MKSKRRIISSMLAFCMVLTAAPITAFASERPSAPASCEAEDSDGREYICHRVEENEVYVAGTKVGTTGGIEYYLNDGSGGITSENASVSNYNVSYDPTSGTITLNGANLSKTSYTDHLVLYETQTYPRDVSDDAVIMARRNITIKVIGENVVENKRKAPDTTYTGLHRHGIDVFANLTITGNGTESSKLTVRSSDQNDGEWANSVGVNVTGGKLTFENVSLTAQGRQTTYCSAGMYVTNGEALISNSDVEIYSSAVKPLNESVVAPSWTGSYGLVSEDGDIVIDNSSINVQAGEGYYSSGVYIISPDDELMIKNNSVLKVTASKEAAVSYGISGSLTVDKAYVEAKSEGAKDIPYTYGGVSYGGYAYSYGYSGYTYDQNNNIISYKVNVENGAACFMSGPCSSGTDTFSCAYDGYIEDLTYPSNSYAVAKYNQSADPKDAKVWTQDCEAADSDNKLVLKSGYQYFEITNEFTPSGTIEWIGDSETQRPKSVEVSLQDRNGKTLGTVNVNSDGDNTWSFNFGKQPVYNCQITGDYNASDAWEQIEYKVAVVNQPAKYDVSISGSAFSEGGFKITEKYDDNATLPPTPTPDYDDDDRIAGDDRFETAVEVADNLKEDWGVSRFRTIIVACSDDFADAMSATPLAIDRKAPILLVNENTEDFVRDYINKNLTKGGKVYIIGETAVVSERFERSLTCSVERLGGLDRYLTNLEVLDELGVTAGDDIMVASALNYPDALSVSATGNPILLVKDKLFDEQKKYLSGLKDTHDYYIIGETEAVNSNVMDEIKAYGPTERVGGADRYETSVDVAEKFYDRVKRMYVASGDGFADALTGGVIANANDAPLLLVNRNNTNQAAAYADAKGVTKVIAIGGTAVIPDEILDKIV